MGLKANFTLKVNKRLSQNWRPKIFLKKLSWLAIKLESKFTLIQDNLNRALNNWAQNSIFSFILHPIRGTINGIHFTQNKRNCVLLAESFQVCRNRRHCVLLETDIFRVLLFLNWNNKVCTGEHWKFVVAEGFIKLRLALCNISNTKKSVSSDWKLLSAL